MASLLIYTHSWIYLFPSNSQSLHLQLLTFSFNFHFTLYLHLLLCVLPQPKISVHIHPCYPLPFHILIHFPYNSFSFPVRIQFTLVIHLLPDISSNPPYNPLSCPIHIHFTSIFFLSKFCSLYPSPITKRSHSLQHQFLSILQSSLLPYSRQLCFLLYPRSMYSTLLSIFAKVITTSRNWIFISLEFPA